MGVHIQHILSNIQGRCWKDSKETKEGGVKLIIIGTPCFIVLSITFLPSLVFFVVLISANVCSHVKRA